jgi:hypothetical protein
MLYGIEHFVQSGLDFDGVAGRLQIVKDSKGIK